MIAELEAQVEQLTAERNLLDERYGLALARAERAEAVIERVREWRDNAIQFMSVGDTWVELADIIDDILDGSDQ